MMLFIVFIFGCSNTENTSSKNIKQNYLEKTNVDYKGKQYYTFYNGIESYEILVPKNWLYKNNKNTALTLYTKKINDTDFTESLDVVSLQAAFEQQNSGTIKSNKVDFDNFYFTHLNDLTENSNLKVISEGEEVVNNSNARWLLLKSANQGEKLNLLKYFIESESRIYIITGTCKESDYAVYGPQFNDIISSFKLSNG